MNAAAHIFAGPERGREREKPNDRENSFLSLSLSLSLSFSYHVFKPVVKPGTAEMDPFVGSNESTRALRCSRMKGRTDGRTDERTESREDAHKRYLEFLRGFSRKYFHRLCRENAFTRPCEPLWPLRHRRHPREKKRKTRERLRGLLTHHAIGS